MRRVLGILGAVLLAAVAPGCLGEPVCVLREPGIKRWTPRVRVLGIAQDGGVPHAGCSCEACEAAAADADRRQFVASLAIIVPDQGFPERAGPDRVYLIDATPDLIPQLRLLADVRDGPAGRVDRSPVDGVFLTHAHVGHYAGLIHFGFESMHAEGVPVWATGPMSLFLAANGPWSQLVKQRETDLRRLTPGEAVDLGAGVTVTPVLVPHRDEFSDTVGFVIAGPSRTVLYIPDTEPWQRWPETYGTLEGILDEHGVDFALLDATFYSLDELPGRHVASIGHPLVVDTMDRLQGRVDAGLTVRFIHLNHSNPALLPGSKAERAIERRGFGVARQGEEIWL